MSMRHAPVDRPRRALCLAAALLAASQGTRAAKAREQRIGVLWTGTTQSEAFGALQARLQRPGTKIEALSGPGTEMDTLAAQLVATHPDLIVVVGTPAAVFLKRLQPAMPVIFAVAGDPVAAGLVTTLARPEGRWTGAYSLTVQTSGKRVALLHDAVPRSPSFGLLWSPQGTVAQELADAQQAITALKLPPQVRSLHVGADVAEVFADFQRAGVRAVSVLTAPAILDRLVQVAEQARRHGVATISGYAGFAEAGGLMSYTADRNETFDAVATMVQRVLAGARPQDLPVLQARSFVLTLNLKTATALGLSPPDWLVGVAQHVIR